MIKSATQLKAKVKNLSGGDSLKAQTLIRTFIMERFLERIALSQYRNHFILKGGMLVAAVVSLDTRATMDIDTTVRSLELSEENAVKIIEAIIDVEIPDDVHFKITKVTDIMEEHDYPGIRFTLEATLNQMRQAIKVDLSTGDIITPDANVRHRPLLLAEINRYVTVHTSYHGLKVTREGILCVDQNSEEQLVPGTTVICALGQRSRTDVVEALMDTAPYVRVIGDASRVSTITNAVYWGYHAALDI